MVFSDHNLRIQKHCCKNPEVRLAESTHHLTLYLGLMFADLAKLQCEQSVASYRSCKIWKVERATSR